MEYHEESFWAGVVLGKQLKGWGTYGRPEGFDPDGDLILRPITQGIGRIHFGTASFHGIRPFQAVLEPVFPVQELPVIVEEFGRITFGSSTFDIRAIAERLVMDEVIKAFTISEEINPLEYDDAIVIINSSGAFTLETEFEEYSEAVNIDHGKLQLLDVDTDRFESIEEQEVTLC